MMSSIIISEKQKFRGLHGQLRVLIWIMGRTHSTHGRFSRKTWSEGPRNRLEDVCVGGNIILKCILK